MPKFNPVTPSIDPDRSKIVANTSKYRTRNRILRQKGLLEPVKYYNADDALKQAGF